MNEALERERQLRAQYDEELRRELPADTEIFDVHVHLGNDIDGFEGDYDELAEIQEKHGIRHAFMFCLDEFDREPGFSAPNDRTLAHAERSGGRLIPFVRLDLAERPLEEAVRCLDLGARGIKLHPRAQGFLCNDERLAPIFELAADRNVPILIHGGRGLPPIADNLAQLLEQHPGAQLIIAHAGIADLAGLASHFAGQAGVFFDTSVWSPIDLLTLYHQVSPEQVLYASDYPYGQQPASLLIALRTARAAGLDESHVRELVWGNAERIASGEPARQPSPVRGSDTFSQPMTFPRIHQYLSMAVPLLWLRQPDTIGIVGLALNACDERDGHAEERERIKELLVTARDLWQLLPDAEEEKDQRLVSRATYRMIHLADILAVTVNE